MNRGTVDAFEVVIGLIVFAFVVLFVGAIIYDGCSTQPRLKDECRDRGGRVVEIHSSGRGAGWYCQETPNAEATP